MGQTRRWLRTPAHYVPLGARFSRAKLADFGSPEINQWHNTISRPSSSRAICSTLIVGLPDFNTTISPGLRCGDMLGSNTAWSSGQRRFPLGYFALGDRD